MKLYTNNSFSHMQAFKGGQHSLKYPLKLYIDITQDCNMFCIMCRDKLTVSGKTMDFDLYKRIVDETSDYVSSFSLFNWGEPLLVKDFRERVLYLVDKKRPDATIDISTNGILLSKGMIDFLSENDIIVSVSFDGANSETFEKIRRGGNFNHICKNIETLASAYEGKNIQYVPGIYTSIQKDNWTQLLDIAMLANKMSVKRMGFGLVVAPEQFGVESTNELRSIIKQTKEYLDNVGMLNDLYPTKVGQYLWDGNNYYDEENYIVDKCCNAPFVSASIAWNGDVFLCCNVGEYVDNISNKSFHDIWTGDKYEKLRTSVNNLKTMPERCVKCTWFNR